MIPLRCTQCRALLAMLDLAPGSRIEIRCRHCKTVAQVVAQPLTSGVAVP